MNMTQTMDKQSFTTTFLVDQTPREVFNAINTIGAWWTGGDIEGSTDKLNGDFVYQVKDVDYSKMKVIEVIPDEKVVWLATDASLHFVKDKSAWTSTKVRFEISQQGNKTQLIFTHEGLVPQFECYDVCSTGWTRHVQGSLLPLITTGKGHPNQKESATKTDMEMKTSFTDLRDFAQGHGR
ncbi:MAG TPA: SRPBCC domain-containing protein [Ktedonobacteraceae bacterium]|nr:SRPBCC domain-containing protein [Ktedonobacteraceae bacterium]